MKPKTPPRKYDRPEQDLPAEIVSDILGFIRNQFYADADPKRWFQDASFLKLRVVTWPAKWLTSRGVSLPPKRYRAILMEILFGIKKHGQTASVAYWPAYLAKCVQDHFSHNGETYYEEGKAMRTVLERTLSRLPSATPTPRQDPIETLAQIHSILASARRAQRPGKPSAKQLDLL